MTMSLADRLWARVDKSGECWNWTGATKTGGYGNIGDQGLTLQTHRLAWRLANGEIPMGLFVLHRCDNRRCVNPDHLFLGTAADNIHDAMAKGRNRRGERMGTAKLTTEQVIALRGRRAFGESIKALAESFGVQKSTVSRIARGDRRPYEPGPRSRREFARTDVEPIAEDTTMGVAVPI